MMTLPPIKTEFAPAERASLDTRTAQIAAITNVQFLKPLLAAIPNPVLILNQHREIVYANSAFLQLINVNDLDGIVGQRLGEAVYCEHAFKLEGGCGTTRFCSTCGAVKAMLGAQKGRQMTEECRITTKDADGEIASFDLRVTAVPQNILDDRFTIFTLHDISNEKRRRILEHIFFHDITNTAGAIYGLAEIMADMNSLEEFEEFGVSEMLTSVSARLIDEIQAQRQLLAAESGDLSIHCTPFYSENLLRELLGLYKNHQVAEHRQLVLGNQLENMLLNSDRALLGRVIGNMIKNALEASTPGQTVTVGCQQLFDYCRIWVHNQQVIPERVQLQIFNRSFSTKGNGRGLGTYSMKLLTENYLQGRVSFKSSPEDGTTFMAMVPIEWNEKVIKDTTS